MAFLANNDNKSEGGDAFSCKFFKKDRVFTNKQKLKSKNLLHLGKFIRDETTHLNTKFALKNLNI